MNDGHDDSGNNSGAVNSSQSAPISSGAITSNNIAAPVVSGLSHPSTYKRRPQSVSVVTEDVVINNLPKAKKNKKPILFLIIMIAIIVGVAVAFFVINRKDNRYEAPFNSYIDLLDGKGGEKFSNISIASLTESINQGQDMSYYAEELQSRYNTFVTEFDDTKFNGKNVERSKNVANYLSNYSNYVKAVTSYFSLSSLNQKILDIYIIDGQNAAQEYIDSFKIADDTSARDMLDDIYAYLTIQLQIFRAYRQAGCISGNEINPECTVKLGDSDDPTFLKLVSSATSEMRNLKQSAAAFLPDFTTQTDNLKGLLEKL